MHEPTHLDLFSGIGGFALAAGWAGFRTIAFSEIDTYASAVLKKHWPDVPNLGDIRELDGRRYAGAVDLATAGVPCQPASTAGRRQGSTDQRWLWPQAVRVISECRPTFALLENPPGILTVNDGLEFEQVLASLECHGYSVQAITVPACAVDAPHRRNRIWILANANRPGLEEQRQQLPWQECQAPERSSPTGPCIWPTEPDVGRVAHGVSRRVDRLKGLGNAIVPQVAYQILKAIREQL